ncbi:hypothetical protein MANES_09G088666v8 [Manihot esculenta]|uniref:Uncharacterized protein n=1 Tax=Manihot esculenta TaxID=3983 RepID=A0ACB7H6T8_MANES|nr:hypothetical protein MANES_09G088666v8 [Manihot esculenta]
MRHSTNNSHNGLDMTTKTPSDCNITWCPALRAPQVFMVPGPSGSSGLH